MECASASTPEELERVLAASQYDAAILDWEMKTQNARELFATVRSRESALPIVVVTSDQQAVSALRRDGAADVVLKPFEIDPLRTRLQRFANRVSATAPAKEAAAQASPIQTPVEESQALEFNSVNPVMQRTLEVAWRVAPTNASVLILGENGTGKTALANAIHRRSQRAKMPFVTVNCPCLQPQLLESELFGHVKGAFTGAIVDTVGKVAAADGGTLFLDEVGELPMEIQPKLLRLLQDREYERLGEHKPRRADIRVIAATNRDLKAEVKAGRFREDLYYRLNVISIEVLPLRQRPEDISPAAEYFLGLVTKPLKKDIRGFSLMAREALESYSWPGNLRELRNAIERAAILTDSEVLDLEDLNELIPAGNPTLPQVGDFVSLDVLEEEHIRQVVARAGSYEHAARILGIDKSTLYRKRKRSHERVTDFASAAAQPA